MRGVQEKMITEDEFLCLNGLIKEYNKSSHKKNYEYFPLNVYYGDVDHPVPGQIDHWVS
jgi:hypothetical protein